MSLVLLCILLLFTPINSEWKPSPLPNPFPKPQNTHERTAILISGQLRSGNISLASKYAHVYNGKGFYRNKTETRTPIQTVIDGLVAPLAIYGGVDIFFYTTVSRNSSKEKSWDGNPLTYEGYEGDTRACELYSNNPIFHQNTGNKVYCLAEYDKQLMDSFITNFTYWKNYFRNEPFRWEAFLQQEYGKYRANLASKSYALMNGINYAYKVRLRPDEAILQPLPSIDKFKFVGAAPGCKGDTVYYPDSTVYGYSSVDSFNIGRTVAMDKILDRYMYMITEEYDWKGMQLYHGRWSSELHLKHMLRHHFDTCLVGHAEILMTKIRTANYTKIVEVPKKVDRDWLLMKGYDPRS